MIMIIFPIINIMTIIIITIMIMIMMINLLGSIAYGFNSEIFSLQSKD